MINLKILFGTLTFLLVNLNMCFSQADLKISNIKGVPNTVVPGEVVYYTFDIENIGTEIAVGNYTIRKYISRDRYFDDEDIEVGYVPTGNTPIGKIENVVGGVTIPETYSNRSLRLIFVIDADNQIAESDEGNNVYIFNNSTKVKLPYIEEDCSENLGFDHEFLCQDIIDNGYEIYTNQEGNIHKHVVDLSGNILSSEVIESETSLSINEEERLLEEKDYLGNVLDSKPLPNYLFDEYPTMRVIKLFTGEYVFYYNLRNYSPSTFLSMVVCIKTSESFEKIDVYDDIFNHTGSAAWDKLKGLYPTNDGGFYVNYEFHKPTWMNTYYSYLVKYDSEGNYNLEHHREAYSIELKRTPCGLKRSVSDNSGGAYSGVNNIITYWNNNANTLQVSNSSSGRYGAYSYDYKFVNTNIRTAASGSHIGVSQPYTVYVSDEEEIYSYEQPVFSENVFGQIIYLLNGEDETFLYLAKTTNGYLKIAQYPCSSDPVDCTADTDEIETLDFTHIGSFDNSEYYLSNNSDNMYATNAFLEEYGFNLASINSEEENDFLYQYLSEMTYIGLNDLEQEGVLSWGTEDAVSFSNFDPDCFFCGTNTGQNDHVVMNQWNGKWSWTNAWSSRPFIVEIPCETGRPSLRMSNPNINKTDGISSIAKIYPNPSSDFINVQVEAASSSKNAISIFNSLGKSVFTKEYEFQQEDQLIKIDVSQFPSGVYFVRLMNGEQNLAKKFVKE